MCEAIERECHQVHDIYQYGVRRKNQAALSCSRRRHKSEREYQRHRANKQVRIDRNKLRVCLQRRQV